MALKYKDITNIYTDLKEKHIKPIAFYLNLYLKLEKDLYLPI